MEKANNVAEVRGGFLVGREPLEGFREKLVSENIIDEASRLFISSERSNGSEEHELAQTVVYHSLSFEDLLVPGYVWPEDHVILVSPPTPESLVHLIKGGAKVLGRIALKSVYSESHRTLLFSGAREVFGRHPVETVQQGVRGINRDAVGEVAEVYEQLDPELRPEVHVVTPSREQMFEYGEEFVQSLKSYGFTHHPIVAGHNAPHTSSDALAVVIREILQK